MAPVPADQTGTSDDVVVEGQDDVASSRPRTGHPRAPLTDVLGEHERPEHWVFARQLFDQLKRPVVARIDDDDDLQGPGIGEQRLQDL
ncbi:MAG: hypothetical protein JO286_16110, partial [Solirubrobacterales bacterium]|nr:hypothetical protein [Solirubrobacterales bacterium]